MGIFAPENGPCSSDSPVSVSVMVVVAPVAALITRPMSSSSAIRVSSVASVVVLGTDLRPSLLCFFEAGLVVVRRLHLRVVHPRVGIVEFLRRLAVLGKRLTQVFLVLRRLDFQPASGACLAGDVLLAVDTLT